MSLEPQLDPLTAAANMAEMEPPYTQQQARVEASRCLNCFDAPCITACPTGIDIPGFIKKIEHAKDEAAGRTILEANILGASCARVCPTDVLCEGACVLNARDEKPIEIGRLQRHATDFLYDRGIRPFSAPTEKSGKRVALVGSGPASLGCAAELALLGHEAVVFEKSEQPGGLNTYGIAYYKMPPAISLQEVDLIRSLGVEFRCGVEVGNDPTLAQLREEFDAVFLGVGLGQTRALGIPGEELEGVVDALSFIQSFHAGPLHETPVGRQVVVLGCGNTAIDAVTQAKRLGAESATIVYRRTPREMSAYYFEYELAMGDGCDFAFEATPVEILGDGKGGIRALRCRRTRPAEGGGVETVPDSDFELPCDMVIEALGQEKQQEWLASVLPGLELDRAGRVIIDPASGQTTLAGVYCGGDAVNGGKEVVNAVADGRKAARGMHSAFTGEQVSGPVQASRHGVAGEPSGSGYWEPVRVPERARAKAGL